MNRKIWAFVLSVLILTPSVGCKEQESELTTADKGRYVEEEVILSLPPHGVGEMFLKNDTISFLDNIALRIYTENAEKTKFTYKAIPFENNNVFIGAIACSKDGDYMIYMEDEQNSCFYITADGKEVSWNLEALYLSEAAFSEDNRLFACDINGGVYEFDTESGSSKLLFSGSNKLTGFDVTSDYIIAVDSDTVHFYNLETNQIMETPEAMQNFSKDQGLTSGTITFDFCQGDEDTIYIASEKGLYRYVMNGNHVEQLLDGMSYHLSDPSYSICSVIKESDDAFLINYENGSVMRYRYDPTASNEVQTLLKIYSLTENVTLQQAINEFRTQNPTVRIDYTIGMSNDDETTYEDAVKNLNTEILAGNGPDIMLMDDMDIDNYVENNMLIDLSEYESTIDPENILLDNVAKWNDENGLYTIACKFEIPVLAARQDVLDQVDSLSALAEETETFAQKSELEYHPVVQVYTAKDILEKFMQYVGADILTEDSVNAAQLQQMLEDCKKIYDSTCNKDARDDAEYWYAEEKRDPSLYNVGTYAMNVLTDPDYYLYAIGTVNGFESNLNFLTSLHIDDDEIAYRNGLTQNDHVFLPSCNLGICAASENKEIAADFLAVTCSDAVQTIELYDGLPVNTKTLQKFYEKDESKGLGISTQDGDILSLQVEWMDDTEVAEFQQMIAALDTPIVMDAITKDTLLSAGIDCLDGIITPEDAVAEITDTLHLRLQE